MSDSYTAIDTVYSDQPTNRQFFLAQLTVSVTLATGTWRELNIFIDVLYPTIHSWWVMADWVPCRDWRSWVSSERVQTAAFQGRTS